MKRLLLAASTVIVTTAAPTLAAQPGDFVFRYTAAVLNVSASVPNPETPEESEEPETPPAAEFDPSNLSFFLSYFNIVDEDGSGRLTAGDQVLAEVTVDNRGATPLSSIEGLTFYAGSMPLEASSSCSMIGAGSAGTCAMSHTVTQSDICDGLSGMKLLGFGAYAFALHNSRWLPSSPDITMHREVLIDRQGCPDYTPPAVSSGDISDVEIIARMEHFDWNGDGVADVGEMLQVNIEFQHEGEGDIYLVPGSIIATLPGIGQRYATCWPEHLEPWGYIQCDAQIGLTVDDIRSINPTANAGDLLAINAAVRYQGTAGLKTVMASSVSFVRPALPGDE